MRDSPTVELTSAAGCAVRFTHPHE
eukprot:COSAG03_NODE_14675_length_456_cov_0.705882_1_plen_24_part_10